MVDPANSNHVYAASALGGVWQSTNGGATWTALTDTQQSLAAGSLIPDPTNSQAISVGTGEENGLLAVTDP